MKCDNGIHERTIGKGGSAYDKCRHCGEWREPDDFNRPGFAPPADPGTAEQCGSFEVTRVPLSDAEREELSINVRLSDLPTIQCPMCQRGEYCAANEERKPAAPDAPLDEAVKVLRDMEAQCRKFAYAATGQQVHITAAQEDAKRQAKAIRTVLAAVAEMGRKSE